jgi:hypothetical protein
MKNIRKKQLNILFVTSILFMMANCKSKQDFKNDLAVSPTLKEYAAEKEEKKLKEKQGKKE